jgi:pheophorbide a oxygenase
VTRVSFGLCAGSAPDGGNGKPGDTAESYDSDKLLMNIAFFTVPVTATSSRVFFRSESYSPPIPGIKGWMVRNTPQWISHMFLQSAILDGDMVFLNRQSMQMLHGQLTWKDYFMPAPADMATIELWRQFNKYSPNGINYYPHEVENDVLPQEQLLDRYEQHVKNCNYCSVALQNLRRGMWVALTVAALASAASFVTAVGCLVTGMTGGWQVGVGGAIIAAVAFQLWRFMKGVEKKFLFEPYVHQDKN